MIPKVELLDHLPHSQQCIISKSDDKLCGLMDGSLQTGELCTVI